MVSAEYLLPIAGNGQCQALTAVYVMAVPGQDGTFIKLGYKNLDETQTHLDKLIGYLENKSTHLQDWYRSGGSCMFLFFPSRCYADMPEPGKAAEAALISAFLSSQSLAVQVSNKDKSRTEFSSSLEYMFVASASVDVTTSDALKDHLRSFSGQRHLEPFVVEQSAGGSKRAGRKQLTRNGDRPSIEDLAEACRAAELRQLTYDL